MLYITSHGRRTGKGFCSVSSVFSLVASISDKAVMYRVNSSKLTEPSLSNQHVDGTRGVGRWRGEEMEGGGDGGCGDGKMEREERVREEGGRREWGEKRRGGNDHAGDIQTMQGAFKPSSISFRILCTSAPMVSGWVLLNK